MNIRKKGRGFGMVQVVALLLIVAGIVAFWPLLKAIAGTITGQGGSATCYLSLIPGEGTARCPIDELTISADKVEVNGKKFLVKGSRTADEMAKEALSKSLKSCLTRGGGLNSQAFKREFGIGDGDNKICLECFNVKFDPGFSQITNFDIYLEDQKSKISMKELTKDSGHRKVYLEFGKEKSLIPPGNIDPKKEYTIFFIGVKEDTLLGSLLDPAVREFVFDYEDLFFTYMVESNRLGSVCDIKVN